MSLKVSVHAGSDTSSRDVGVVGVSGIPLPFSSAFAESICESE